MQALLVALPRARRFAWLEAFRSPWWALVPAGSIVVVIGIVAWEGESATALSWLALVAVPPFAALALGWLVHGSRPEWAAAIAPLFVVAWASPGSLLGEAAATALTGLGCIGLGWLLASVAPARWLKWGIYAMATVDTVFVAADLLQGPNAVLTAAAPSGLPRLQAIHFGSALMGFGDLFIAATLGCLLALPARRRQLFGAALVAVLGLGFDLLFFAVDTLPATVPVALALALIELRDRLRAGDPGDREDQGEARRREGDFAP
ncbi:MAG TPA: hypothetical protein VFI09_06745 [Solirubrobacterales bacterium]|nr:hypothetical protein [Solirubrobacterales bacterium]